MLLLGLSARVYGAKLEASETFFKPGFHHAALQRHHDVIKRHHAARVFFRPFSLAILHVKKEGI